MRRRKEKMGLRLRMLERKEDGSGVSGEKMIGTLKKRKKYSIQEEPTQQGWYVRVQQCWKVRYVRTQQSWRRRRGRLKITIQSRKVRKRRRIFEDHPRRFRKEGETFLLRKGRSMEKWTGRGVEDGKAAHHLRGFPPLCAPIFPSEKNN